VNGERPTKPPLSGNRLPRPRTVVRAYPLELWQKIAGDGRGENPMLETGKPAPRPEAEGTAHERET
jgi:hypothetical protein